MLKRAFRTFVHRSSPLVPDFLYGENLSDKVGEG